MCMCELSRNLERVRQDFLGNDVEAEPWELSRTLAKVLSGWRRLFYMLAAPCEAKGPAGPASCGSALEVQNLRMGTQMCAAGSVSPPEQERGGCVGRMGNQKGQSTHS